MVIEETRQKPIRGVQQQGRLAVATATLVGESEGWLIAASILCNSSYWLAWCLLARMPSLSTNWARPAAVWNSTALTVLAAELGFIAVTIALTFFFQSRKRDFI